MNIVVDGMGGDHAPAAIVAGVVEAVKEFEDIQVTLIGIESAIRNELQKHKYPAERVSVVHAPEVVEMDEPAITPIRKKRDSSIAQGVQLLKGSDHDAFISAGNTAAVVAASTIYLGMMPGVERPAIGLVIPTVKKFAFLIDVGANTASKSQHLLQSALMANVYAREVLGVQSPSVGLLNIGSEESKGTDVAKETHKMMADRLQNFIGNIEANAIFDGECDCIICDGFVGNVIIKVSESLMESAATLLRREIKKSPIALFGAILMKSRLNHIKKHADYSEYGGAPLLGVNGLVMISHGRSSPKAIKNAIRATRREIEHDIFSTMMKEIGV